MHGRGDREAEGAARAGGGAVVSRHESGRMPDAGHVPAANGAALSTAGLLRLQRTAGNAAVRGMVAEVQRDRQAPASLQPRLTRDALYEQMAHEFAYIDGAIPASGMALLNHYQYRPVPVAAVHGQAGFQMRTFQPTVQVSPNPTPVVAFRGTQFELSGEAVSDLAADADAGGIGVEQFFRNAGLIERHMRSAARSGHNGKVIVTGHSLGGALAQIAAATYPDLIDQVVTFQSPGINRDLVERMSEHNRGARQRGERGVQSTHYRAMGDIVPLAGAGFTEGTIHNMSIGMTDPISAHRAFITTGFASQQRGGVPLPFAGLPSTEGFVNHTGSESTDENNTEFRATELIRRGAGAFGGINMRGGGPLGIAAYLLEQRQIAERQRVWLAIQAAMDAGQSSEIAPLITGSVLNERNRQQMARQAIMALRARTGR